MEMMLQREQQLQFEQDQEKQSPGLSQEAGITPVKNSPLTNTDASMYSQFHQKNMSNPYYLQAFRERQASSSLAQNPVDSQQESPEYGDYRRPAMLFAGDSNSVQHRRVQAVGKPMQTSIISSYQHGDCSIVSNPFDRSSAITASVRHSYD